MAHRNPLSSAQRRAERLREAMKRPEVSPAPFGTSPLKAERAALTGRPPFGTLFVHSFTGRCAMRLDAIPRARLLGLLGLLGSTGLLACNEVASSDTIPAPEPLKIAPDAAPYPKGPYGVAKGSTIANYAFKGFINPIVDSSALQPIVFNDFYNPHADDSAYQPESPELDDRLYAKGSLFGEGRPRPRALLINVAAVWCGPCNEEAKSTFPGKYAKYKPCGGEFFLELAESAIMGEPASQKNLTSWGKKFKVDYPIALDPTYQLASVFDANAYPGNMIVDPRTMTVVSVVAGVPSEAFWQKFEEIIDDPECLAKN